MTSNDIKRRGFLGALSAAPFLAARRSFAQAAWPAGPIKLIVPSSAGGVHDVVGRLWAQRLGEVFGTIVVEDNGGAGGAIGVAEAVRAPKDGYTLLLGSNSTHILNPLIMKAVKYDPIADFEVCSIFAKTSTAIAVSAATPFQTLTELIDFARANPGKLSYAHGGGGSISHVSGELFKRLAGNLVISPVPYRGMGPAQADVMGNQVPLFFPNLTGQVVALRTNGNLRILAVDSPARHRSLPDVPTAVEAGLPGMIAESFFGIFAPAGTPAAIAARINAETDRAVGTNEFRQMLAAGGFDPIAGIGPDATKAYLRAELARWQPIVRDVGISVD